MAYVFQREFHHVAVLASEYKSPLAARNDNAHNSIMFIRRSLSTSYSPNALWIVSTFGHVEMQLFFLSRVDLGEKSQCWLHTRRANNCGRRNTLPQFNYTLVLHSLSLSLSLEISLWLSHALTPHTPNKSYNYCRIMSSAHRQVKSISKHSHRIVFTPRTPAQNFLSVNHSRWIHNPIKCTLYLFKWTSGPYFQNHITFICAVNGFSAALHCGWTSRLRIFSRIIKQRVRRAELNDI